VKARADRLIEPVSFALTYSSVPVQIDADVLLQATDHLSQESRESIVLLFQARDARFERLGTAAMFRYLTLLK